MKRRFVFFFLAAFLAAADLNAGFPFAAVNRAQVTQGGLTIPHVDKANDRLSLVGISPGYQVIQDADSGSGAGVTYTYNGPSSALTAAFINENAPDAKGIYTKRALEDGRFYYNLLGQSDSRNNSVIIYKNLGGVLGFGWGVFDSANNLLYYSIQNPPSPWEVETWITLMGTGTLGGNLSSITNGEMHAGVTLAGGAKDGIYKVTGAQDAKNIYTSLADGFVLLDPTTWLVDGGNPQTGEYTAFPWQVVEWSDATIATQNDIAVPGNWTPNP